MLLACVPYVTFYGSSAILYAVNRQARDAVVATILNPSIVAGMAAAMRFGLVATSAAVAVIPWLLLPLPVLAVSSTGHVRARDILLPQIPTLLAAAAMCGAISLLRTRLAPYVPDVTALPVLILAGVALYAILIVMLMPRRAISIAGQLGGRLMTAVGRQELSLPSGARTSPTAASVGSCPSDTGSDQQEAAFSCGAFASARWRERTPAYL